MKNKFIIISLLFLFLLGCNTPQHKADFARLVQLDTLLQTSPDKTVDSLKNINPKNLSKYNYGYFILLDVISKDKTYFTFSSDSLIKLSSTLLEGKKNEYPINYARSLMYCGFVRYRMGIRDSTAYEPIKQAIEYMETNRFEVNHSVLFLCYYYLGVIQEDNSNLNYSIQYFLKAAENAKKTGNQDYIISAYTSLFWIYLRKSEYNLAKYYMDALKALKNTSYEEKIGIAHISATYNYHIGNYKQALVVNKKLLLEDNYPQDLSPLYIRISYNYQKTGQLDSALYYAELAEKHIPDTTSAFLHYYYKNIGEISEKLHLWQKSSVAYKKAYELRNKAVRKDLDNHILELEKKYDLKKVENKMLRIRNRGNIMGLSGIILVVVLIALLIILRQRGKQSSMRARLITQENQLLEQKKVKVERELIEKEFILPLYQQISQRNAKIKSFLSDLLTNSHLAKNKQLSQKISETYQDFISTSNIHADNFLTNEKFTEFTGIESENCKLLNENEKMLLVFVAMKLDNKQIAVLFNTTESSIRGRKAKLRIKLQVHNIDIKNIII
ncbi:exported hypothetical protein [uncultured Paludibacter sp.]|nr:exported hypothetical protein [uncultured Paludibacter sp.]